MNEANRKKVLVIEDDASLNALLVEQVAGFGCQTQGARSRAEARQVLADFAPDLILLDMRLPDSDGFELLEELGHLCPVIILSAFGTVDQAMKAVRAGAADYLFKPVSHESLKLAVTRAFETIELKRDVRHWQTQAQRKVNETLVGESAAVEKIRGLIALYGEASSPVLIEGESGVGKELVARAIHQSSPRAQGRFVPVDCDPSQETVTLSELFGHEAGAMAGTDRRREGMIEIAAGGTIYIADIAEISPAMQSRLLRVMETGIFRRHGGAQDLTADVRIIAATSADLAALVKAGKFRSELYYRLSAFTVRVPPLRERRGDVRALAQHFLAARSYQRGTRKEFAAETLDALEGCDWFGNVRELRNAVERGTILSGQEPEIRPEHLALLSAGARAATGTALQFSGEPTIEQVRDDYLRLLLARHGGNRQKVAAILGISERNTYRLISKLPDAPGGG